MRRQKPIQVSFQLPQGALDGFTRLVEQLRLLSAQLSGGSGPAAYSAEPIRERMENPSFDWERFYDLGRGAAQAESVQAPDLERDAPRPIQEESVPAPADSGEDLVEQPAPAGERENSPLEARAVREEADSPVTEAVQANAPPERPLAEAPQAQAPPETPLAEAPAVQMEPESGIPEAEAVWAEAEARDLSPTSAHAEALSDVKTPESAGFSITAGPESGTGRWTGIAEELSAPGPAPLTAEAVSRAFQRDGRRYDNGFPLY